MFIFISALTSEVLKFSIKHSFEFVDLNEEVDPEGNPTELLCFPHTMIFIVHCEQC